MYSSTNVLARSHRQSTAAKKRADKAEGASRVIRWAQRRCKGFVQKAFGLWSTTAEAITLRDRITTEFEEEMERMRADATERVEAIRTRLQATEVNRFMYVSNRFICVEGRGNTDKATSDGGETLKNYT